MKKLKIKGIVSMAPDYNDSIFSVINLPSDTPLLQAPKIMQNGDYGVYAGGVGVFYQEYLYTPTMFIYPLYSHTRYDTSISPRLMFLVVDEDKYTELSNYHSVEGNIVKIVVAGGLNLFGTPDVVSAMYGEGVKIPKPGVLDTRPIHVNTKGLFEKRGEEEVFTILKADNDIKTPGIIATVKSTENVYKHSELFLRNRTFFTTIPWKGSEIDLLIPGMPGRIFREIYVDKINDEGVSIKELVVTSRECTLMLVDERIDPTTNERIAELGIAVSYDTVTIGGK
jgi:hypothetical protein